MLKISLVVCGYRDSVSRYRSKSLTEYRYTQAAPPAFDYDGRL